MHQSDELLSRLFTKHYTIPLNERQKQTYYGVINLQTQVRFAPNDPTQNPIEDIWLQAKRFIREHYHLCQSFEAVKVLS